eukprot:6278762-Ditylum_brightwellii.AAC.1
MENVGTWQDSIDVLEHVNVMVSYSYGCHSIMALETSVLPREAGFEEAQCSLELLLKILEMLITAGDGVKNKEVTLEDENEEHKRTT